MQQPRVIIKLSKLNVAIRQANTAVRMFFAGEDPVAVHTMAGAASVIFTDLMEAGGLKQSWEKTAAEKNNMQYQDFLSVVRKSQNFFKHADKNPTSEMAFDPCETEGLLSFISFNWGDLIGIEQKISVELSVFQLWFLAVRESMWRSSCGPIREAIKMFPGIEKLDRGQQLARGCDVLNQCLSC